MQTGYDRAITVFSPDGRLFQVEYAREAVKRGTTVMGIRAIDGAVLLVDKNVSSRLIEVESIEKLHLIDNHIGAAASGLSADTRVLVKHAVFESQLNRVTYSEPIGIETLVKKVCDIKQSYTQSGGVRPFGTAFLFIGASGEKIQLFETDPSGAFFEYKATAIGFNKVEIMKLLEEKYRDDITLQDAVVMGIDILKNVFGERFDISTVEIGIIKSQDKLFRKISQSKLKEISEGGLC